MEGREGKSGRKIVKSLRAGKAVEEGDRGLPEEPLGPEGQHHVLQVGGELEPGGGEDGGGKGR